MPRGLQPAFLKASGHRFAAADGAVLANELAPAPEWPVGKVSSESASRATFSATLSMATLTTPTKVCPTRSSTILSKSLCRAMSAPGFAQKRRLRPRSNRHARPLSIPGAAIRRTTMRKVFAINYVLSTINWRFSLASHRPADTQPVRVRTSS
jgi:hypothetical protein